MLFHFFLAPCGFRQGHIEEGFFGHFLKRPRRIHGGEGQRPREWWCLFHNRQHLRWDFHNVLGFEKITQATQRVTEGLQELVRCRMVFLQLFQDLLRGLVRVDLGCGVLEGLLVEPQVGHADLQQPVERNVNGFVIQKFLAEVVRANAEVAMRLWLQLFLNPLLVALELVHDFLVDDLKLFEQRRVFYVFERCGHIILKEADKAGNLLQCDVNIDRRRVLQVLPRGLKHRGNLLLPRDHRFQALVRRSKRPRHNDEDRVGNAGRVAVRVFLPRADVFQREQVRVDVILHQLPIHHVLGSHAGLSGRKLLLEFFEDGNLPVDRSP